MRYKFLFLLVASVLMLASCTAPKDLTYFQDFNEDKPLSLAQSNFLTVKPGDKLRIVVSTYDETLAAMFNLQAGSRSQMTSGAANSTTILGYTVNAKGDIDFPYLGEVHIAGLTRDQVATKIKSLLEEKKFIQDPTVVVDFLNSAVDIMGDVKTPGRYSISNDRYTVLDALSSAGDLNLTAKRTNVKVIRTQDDGSQAVYVLDLTDAESLYQSPGFFIQQNDLVYVEPNDKRKRESTTQGNALLQYGFWISLASLLISASLLIK